MALIRTHSLEKIYNSNSIEVHALKGIDLSVDDEEFLVIAGESGSGKTTLLNLIGTLDIATKGKIYLNNEDISQKNSKELSNLRLNNIGFIFQAYNLIPVLSALENVEFTMMLQGISEKERYERSMSVMAELGIETLAKKRPNQMSGGQQQRVAVARAIVNDPLLVLADEPTANLDTKTGGNLLDLMQKMNEEKKITFIFSSHDKQVMSRAKRLIYLEDGLVIQDSSK